MQTFALPAFYLPWPGRRNPHLAGTRAACKAWSYEMGILGGGRDDPGEPVWDEASFDAMDIAALAAYGHPDAAPADLDLIAEWYVWGFYVDDFLLHVYKRPNDRAGATTYLAGLPRFMPADPSAAAPEPADPVQRGLTDLWARTTPNRSPVWRQRFRCRTNDTLQDTLWEMTNIETGSVPNPIECFDSRRKLFGGGWAAMLVEYAAGIDLAAPTVASRACRVLTETFADGAFLRNDLFSYQREINEEGELDNMVLALECFLGISPQEAAEVTNDVLTSRMYLFEHTLVTEVEPMFEELGLDTRSRGEVLRYAAALQDAQAGLHEWSLHSTRYRAAQQGTPRDSAPCPVFPFHLPGLQHAAARIGLSQRSTGLRRRMYGHAPFSSVGPVTPGPVHMPFAVGVNQHLDASRRDTLDWCRAMGMLAAVPGPVPIGVWNERQLSGDDFALWAAASQPDVPLDTLNLAAQWLAWRAYADDALAYVLGAGWNLPASRRFPDRLAQFMPADGVQRTPPTNPVERGLADLWGRTGARLSRAGRDLLGAAVLSLAEGWAWELANQAYNRVPDLADYLEMRRHTSGSGIQLALIQASLVDQVPAEALAARPVRALMAATQDVVGLVNDLFSYQREIEYEGDLNNAVLAVETLLGCSRERSAAIIANLACARVLEFERLLELELPALLEDLRLAPERQDCLTGAISRLKSWMSGTLHWHETTCRYGEPTLINSLALCRRVRGPFPHGAGASEWLEGIMGGPVSVGVGCRG